MVKFNPSENTYKLEVSSDKITMSFKGTFKSTVKFVKIDGTFKKGSEITDSLNIDNGSLVQIGYKDIDKLVVTEPAWVEIINVDDEETIVITHSI